MVELPVGTVTFVFTDVEGSTKLLVQDAQSLSAALELHLQQIRAATDAHGGVVFETAGDGAFAAFPSASGALSAVLDVQRQLQHPPGPELPLLRIRAAVHTGDVEVRGSGYFGAPLFRCARLLAVAHGGQTLVSRATHDLTRDSLPEGAQLRSLGVHRLRDLAMRDEIFQLVHRDLPSDFPPLASLDSMPNNLPMQLTSFVGREDELALVDRLLRRGRLVTLTGAGGSGKTRLAVEAAAAAADRFPDGTWLIDLSGLAGAGLLVQEVAGVIGVREEPTRPLLSTLKDALRNRVALLVLDNCETFISEAAEVVDQLLRSAAGLRVLATSRQPLGVGGETAWRVPSLSAPQDGEAQTVDELAQFPAVRLFVDRARAALPSFGLSDANGAAVARITRRLDGIPLAIELAAARLRTIPIDEVADRLDDAFDIVSGGGRAAPARQKTLRAAIDWSYNELDEVERELFARLSVFSGGWTLEGASAVGADAADEPVLALAELVDKSLVVLDDESSGGRYRYLEPIRDYARLRLVESGRFQAARDAHLEFYATWAETVEPHLVGSEQARWFASVEAEHENLDAALAWASESGQAELGLRIAGSLWPSWWVNGRFSQGRRILDELLPLSTSPNRVRARSLVGSGWLATATTDFEVGRRALQEGLDLARSVGDVRSAAWALHGLGVLAAYHSDHVEQAQREREAIDLFRSIDDRSGLMTALGVLAFASLLAGEPERAIELLAEAVAMGREIGNAFGLNFLLLYLGTAKGAVARVRGDSALLAESRGVLFESVDLSRRVGDRFHAALGLEVIAEYIAEEGDPERAARLLGAAQSIREGAQAPLLPIVSSYQGQLRESLRGELHDERFDANWQAGSGLSLDDAIRLARQGDERSGNSRGQTA